jgi:hypothetical protein
MHFPHPLSSAQERFVLDGKKAAPVRGTSCRLIAQFATARFLASAGLNIPNGHQGAVLSWADGWVGNHFQSQTFRNLSQLSGNSLSFTVPLPTADPQQRDVSSILLGENDKAYISDGYWVSSLDLNGGGTRVLAQGSNTTGTLVDVMVAKEDGGVAVNFAIDSIFHRLAGVCWLLYSQQELFIHNYPCTISD